MEMGYRLRRLRNEFIRIAIRRAVADKNASNAAPNGVLQF